jgi:hypothetical protein
LLHSQGQRGVLLGVLLEAGKQSNERSEYAIKGKGSEDSLK